jgi:hypothetical protein
LSVPGVALKARILKFDEHFVRAATWRDRARETDRQIEIDTERVRETETERQRDRQRQREGSTDKFDIGVIARRTMSFINNKTNNIRHRTTIVLNIIIDRLTENELRRERDRAIAHLWCAEKHSFFMPEALPNCHRTGAIKMSSFILRNPNNIITSRHLLSNQWLGWCKEYYLSIWIPTIVIIHDHSSDESLSHTSW